jgi:hypothetical protein
LLFCFLPLLVAISIAASGCRFWLPFCKAKCIHDTISPQNELQAIGGRGNSGIDKLRFLSVSIPVIGSEQNLYSNEINRLPD